MTEKKFDNRTFETLKHILLNKFTHNGIEELNLRKSYQNLNRKISQYIQIRFKINCYKYDISNPEELKIIEKDFKDKYSQFIQDFYLDLIKEFSLENNLNLSSDKATYIAQIVYQKFKNNYNKGYRFIKENLKKLFIVDLDILDDTLNNQKDIEDAFIYEYENHVIYNLIKFKKYFETENKDDWVESLYKIFSSQSNYDQKKETLPIIELQFKNVYNFLVNALKKQMDEAQLTEFQSLLIEIKNVADSKQYPYYFIVTDIFKIVDINFSAEYNLYVITKELENYKTLRKI